METKVNIRAITRDLTAKVYQVWVFDPNWSRVLRIIVEPTQNLSDSITLEKFSSINKFWINSGIARDKLAKIAHIREAESIGIGSIESRVGIINFIIFKTYS